MDGAQLEVSRLHSERSSEAKARETHLGHLYIHIRDEYTYASQSWYRLEFPKPSDRYHPRGLGSNGREKDRLRKERLRETEGELDIRRCVLWSNKSRNSRSTKLRLSGVVLSSWDPDAGATERPGFVHQP